MARALAPSRGLLAGGTLLVAAAIAVPALAVEISPSPSPSAAASAEASPGASASAAPSPSPAPSASPAQPSASPSPASPSPASAPSSPAGSPKPAESESDDERSGPGAEVTRQGILGTTTDDRGRTRYALRAGSTTYILAAGPPWFTGDRHPLEAQVGETVTIGGWLPNGTLTIHVDTVDGAAWREPGRPPWAGGWKAVGEGHPGWSQAKWDRWQAKVADKLAAKGVDCWPPGHCKEPAPSD
jgi:hypothetical protein